MGFIDGLLCLVRFNAHLPGGMGCQGAAVNLYGGSPHSQILACLQCHVAFGLNRAAYFLVGRIVAMR